MSWDRSIEERIRSLRRETPPADLRGRILTLARSIERPRITLTEKLWASRPLRLAWASSLAILLFLDPAMGRRVRMGAALRSVREDDRATIRTLSQALDLGGDRLVRLPYWGDARFDINDARREELASLASELEI